MIKLKNFEVWFITGSQHLYGEETLMKVGRDSKKIAQYLNASPKIPCKVVFKPVVTTPDKITDICVKANTSPKCVGLITWMHTFSPAKMWIAGLSILKKPFVHLHTQFNRDIPWKSIDMGFMNLNQSAHGGREFGFICSRMRKNRKVIVGHWQDPEVLEKLDIWMRAACAWNDWQGMKVARFGDNMREVAVTEGDKVEAQKKFGYSVNGFGVGDLVAVINKVTPAQIDKMIAEYKKTYKMNLSKQQLSSIRESAKIEVGMRKFFRKADTQLQQSNCCKFSEKAKGAMKRRIRKNIVNLLSTSVRLAKNEGLDIVSKKHIVRADILLMRSASRQFFRHLGTIGGIVLGASLSALLAMLSSGEFSISALLITVALIIIGTFMVAIHIVKDF